MTQEQLAKELNTSKSSISDWELGDTLPKIEMAIKLSEMAGVSIDWMFKGDITTEYQQPEGITPEEARLLQAFRNMDAGCQSAVLKLADKASYAQ